MRHIRSAAILPEMLGGAVKPMEGNAQAMARRQSRASTRRMSTDMTAQLAALALNDPEMLRANNQQIKAKALVRIGELKQQLKEGAMGPHEVRRCRSGALFAARPAPTPPLASQFDAQFMKVWTLARDLHNPDALIVKEGETFLSSRTLS